MSINLLITNPLNITYLTGFTGLSPHEREAYVLIAKKKYFFTSSLYLNTTLTQNLKKKGFETRLISATEKIENHLARITNNEQISELGFESKNLTYAEYELLTKSLPVKLIPQEHSIESQRVIKTKKEIDMVREACRIMDTCFEEVLPGMKIGMSEKDIYEQIENWIKRHGVSLAFDPFIVAVDANSALPHYDTLRGSGVIKNGSVLLIDCGVRYQGYVSDITRMAFFGNVSDEVLKTYKGLQKAQETTVKHLASEKNAALVDKFCREELAKYSLPPYGHSTGHGVGLEIHEAPRLSPTSKDTLKDGMIFTIEPGVYYEGKWGIRVEDTVALHDGTVEPLTHFSKGPLILS